MSMSSVTMIGRLTADPEQKIPASGNPYTRMRVAWNNKKDTPGYIDVTLFGRTGEVAAQYLKKGSQFCLSGSQLEWREYEKDDEKRVAYSLVGGNLTLLGNKDDAAGESQQGQSTLRKVDVFNAPATDDDIPFAPSLI